MTQRDWARESFHLSSNLVSFDYNLPHGLEINDKRAVGSEKEWLRQQGFPICYSPSDKSRRSIGVMDACIVPICFDSGNLSNEDEAHF